jgi:hypothetical protein
MARCTHYDDIIEIIVESGVGCGKCMMEIEHTLILFRFIGV